MVCLTPSGSTGGRLKDLDSGACQRFTWYTSRPAASSPLSEPSASPRRSLASWRPSSPETSTAGSRPSLARGGSNSGTAPSITIGACRCVPNAPAIPSRPHSRSSRRSSGKPRAKSPRSRTQARPLSRSARGLLREGRSEPRSSPQSGVERLLRRPPRSAGGKTPPSPEVSCQFCRTVNSSVSNNLARLAQLVSRGRGNKKPHRTHIR